MQVIAIPIRKASCSKNVIFRLENCKPKGGGRRIFKSYAILQSSGGHLLQGWKMGKTMRKPTGIRLLKKKRYLIEFQF
jgi:hypothetical protein